MAFTLGSDIFTSIDEGLSLTYASGLNNFAALIAPLIGAFIALYFVLKALHFLYSGGTNQLPSDVIKQITNLSLFTYFAFNIPYYMDVVVNPVNSIGNEIANAFSSSGKTAPHVIDQMANQILDTIQLIWDNTPNLSLTNLDIQPLLRAISTIVIISIFGTIFMVVSALYLLIAKVLVALVLMLGPLYISAAFFPLTREYFMKWLGQLLNYILLSAMFGFTFTLLTNLLQKFILGAGFASTIPMGDMTNLKLLFTFLLFTGVVAALPALTSQLTGGVGISGMGAVSGLGGSLTRSLTKLVGGGAKAAVGGGGNTIAGGGNKRLG
ncbi:type IV secretion system protein [Cellvibrio sp. OA-2007]|uniref:type IV secretion system protein n=1 Tax=Cellvibrio sp. OA-2007 TaxID=529823 RepID=UPI0007822511|nr:type IV secretion system protein [Cellvibrio sp. OA-2007]